MTMLPGCQTDLVHTSQHKVDYTLASYVFFKQNTNTALVMTSNSPGNCEGLATSLMICDTFILYCTYMQADTLNLMKMCCNWLTSYVYNLGFKTGGSN